MLTEKRVVSTTGRVVNPINSGVNLRQGEIYLGVVKKYMLGYA